MTKNCLLCNQKIVVELDLISLFSFKNKKIMSPVICKSCRTDFSCLGHFRCPICDRTMSRAEICLDCQRWQNLYQGQILRNHSIFEYNSTMHELIKNYKKYGDYELRYVLQDLIKNTLNQFNYDFYVPLPTDPKHIEIRRFDTIQGVFSDLVPLTNILQKTATSKAQSQKNRKERMQTSQSFYINKKLELSGRVLLLDDLYTTGRTMYHARDILFSHYPKCDFESFCIIR